MRISIRSVLSGIDHSRDVGDVEGKRSRLLPSAETRWLLAEGEVLALEADGHSPTKFTIHLRAPAGR